MTLCTEGVRGNVCECRVHITQCTEGVRGLSLNVEFTSLNVQRELGKRL